MKPQNMALGFAFFLFLAAILLTLIGWKWGQSNERQEAVNADVAEWYATQDGKVQFRYKTGGVNVGQTK